MCYRSTERADVGTAATDEETDTETARGETGPGQRRRPFEDLIDLPVRALGRLKARLV